MYVQVTVLATGLLVFGIVCSLYLWVSFVEVLSNFVVALKSFALNRNTVEPVRAVTSIKPAHSLLRPQGEVPS